MESDRGWSGLKLGGDDEPCNQLTVNAVSSGLCGTVFQLAIATTVVIMRSQQIKPDLNVFL
jgi:hypothetical protein